MLTPSRSDLMRIVVVLAAGHSIILGVLLIASPHWLLGLWGWRALCDTFFLQQVGIFHILLGVFYYWEWQTRSGVFVLLLAKTSAFIFLVLQTIFREPQLGAMFAGAFDGAIAAIIWWLHRTEAQVSRKPASPH